MATSAEKMITLYQTNENLLKTILSMYRAIKQGNETHARKKIEIVKPLLDFCYVYFVHHYDITFPSIKIPDTLLKLQLMTSRLKGCSLKNVNLFSDLITDTDYKLIVQQPPAYLTGEKTEAELYAVLNNNIIKKIRKIIDALLSLKH